MADGFNLNSNSSPNPNPSPSPDPLPRWLQLKLKRRRLQRRLHAHLTLLHVYYPWNQIKSILLLNIRVTKQTNPLPRGGPDANDMTGAPMAHAGTFLMCCIALYYTSAPAPWYSRRLGLGLGLGVRVRVRVRGSGYG